MIVGNLLHWDVYNYVIFAYRADVFLTYHVFGLKSTVSITVSWLKSFCRCFLVLSVTRSVGGRRQLKDSAEV